MHSLMMLAQQAPGPRAAWAPVVLMILIGLAFGLGSVAMSLWIGPKRTGPGKASTYESGMVPVGSARQRFNVRFYIVAMIFLVFDVEIVFFYPWASIFPDYVTNSSLRLGPGGPILSTLLLMEMLIFVLILLVAYVYAWGKGVFRWD